MSVACKMAAVAVILGVGVAVDVGLGVMEGVTVGVCVNVAVGDGKYLPTKACASGLKKKKAAANTRPHPIAATPRISQTKVRPLLSSSMGFISSSSKGSASNKGVATYYLKMSWMMQ